MRACPICGSEVTGRRDKVHCSAGCRKAAKSEYDKLYHIKNADKKIKAACEWQAVNREHKQAYDAVYRETHRERRLALKREHGRRVYWEDVDTARRKSVLSSARRRRLIESAGSFTVTLGDIEKMRQRQRGECFYCKERMVRHELEHIIPIARGGTHSIGNLVLSCAGCNRRKGARTIMEWRLGVVIPRTRYVA